MQLRVFWPAETEHEVRILIQDGGRLVKFYFKYYRFFKLEFCKRFIDSSFYFYELKNASK